MSAEDVVENMIRMMNHISIKNRDLSRKSALNSGLTNILLALMFLETLSAVTLLMSQNINISQVNDQPYIESEEIPEPDQNGNGYEENETENEDDSEDEDINDNEEVDEEKEEYDERETKEKKKTQFPKRKKRTFYNYVY